MFIKSNMACKLVSKLIEKKLKECGYDITVHLQELSISHKTKPDYDVEGASFLFKVDGFIPEAELNKLITKLGY